MLGSLYNAFGGWLAHGEDVHVDAEDLQPLQGQLALRQKQQQQQQQGLHPTAPAGEATAMRQQYTAADDGPDEVGAASSDAQLSLKKRYMCFCFRTELSVHIALCIFS